MLSELPCHTVCVHIRIPTQALMDPKPLVLTSSTLSSREVWIGFSGSNCEAQRARPW